MVHRGTFRERAHRQIPGLIRLLVSLLFAPTTLPTYAKFKIKFDSLFYNVNYLLHSLFMQSSAIIINISVLFTTLRATKSLIANDKN